ncbi:MAG: hypothetical protein ACEQSR_03810 [Candidatus Methylacidiphilales bacterium]
MKRLIVILFLAPVLLHSQIGATADNGKKVLLNKNGTWKYVVEKIKMDTIPEKELVAPKKENTFDDSPPNLDCSDLITVDTDKFTGKISISAKGFIKITKPNSDEGIDILTALVRDKTIAVQITAIKSVNCVDVGDKAFFICEDNTKFELVNRSKYNCDGKFYFFLGGKMGNDKELEYLYTKKITAIRLDTKKDRIDVDLPKEIAFKLMKQINCLYNYEN